MTTERMLLSIEGMTYDGCARTVPGLEHGPGVNDADVAFDPSLADEERTLMSRVFWRHRTEPQPSPSCC